MKKIILMLFISIFLISLTLASPGTYKQNSDIRLTQTCSDCTFINISSVIAPDGTQLIGNNAMDKTGVVFNYTLDSEHTSQVGEYRINGLGNSEGTNQVWMYSFEVTYTGKNLSESQSILNGFLFLILFGFMFVLFFIIKTLPSSNTKDEEGKILSISYLKYLRATFWFVEWMLVVGVLYIASNLAFAYLTDTLFADVLFVIFRISFGVTPVIVIVWIAWIFVKMFHDKQLQRLLNRGFFPQGRI